ncbi:MAG: 16S rRNA (cytosine(1402)-N(4))-methyltransferase RsmH, partial [Bacteroidota bacterium]
MILNYHTPVLLNQCIESLCINPEGIYVDATFGGGGHSCEILKHITTGKLFAFDCDEDAMENKIADTRFVLINQNFREIKFFLKKQGVTKIDGLLADLGVSSHQFDTMERGFSTRFDSELDMRMDKRRNKLTANIVLNTYSEQHLKKLFEEFGEIKNAKRLANTIQAKRKQRIRTSEQLKKIIANCVRKGKENQYYAKMFQAL